MTKTIRQHKKDLAALNKDYARAIQLVELYTRKKQELRWKLQDLKYQILQAKAEGLKEFDDELYKK